MVRARVMLAALVVDNLLIVGIGAIALVALEIFSSRAKRS